MSSYSFQGRKRFWTQRDEEENRAIFSGQRQQTGIEMPQEFKPIYLANAEYEVERWSSAQLIRLLRLYGAHRCLWDVRDPDNRCRKMRKAALLDIAAAMGCCHGNGDVVVTRAQIVQKINVLRATYRYERRRIKERIRKGIGAKTKLKWFALADAFLRNIPKTGKFRKTMGADSDSDLEDTVVFNIDPELLIPLNEDDDQKEEEEFLVPHIVKEEAVVGVNFEKYSSQHQCNNEAYDTVHVKLEPETAAMSMLKRPWTARESMHFVQLLQEQPVLWRVQNIAELSEMELDAIAAIAEAMHLPPERIRNRIAIFKSTWQEESAKIARDPAYRPQFVWWPIAADFMTQSNAAYDNFVDANDVPPPTPKNIYEITIKTEHEEDDNGCEDDMKNPIPSVMSTAASAIVEQSMATLFNECHSVAADKLDDCSTSTDISSGKNCRVVSSQHNAAEPANGQGGGIATKLIWNGLEDDLLEGKWSLKHSVKFLRLYGAHRCLWDLADAGYRSRELRHAAIKDIAAAMGYGLDADYVAKKIKIFRITYMQHRKRMLEAHKQGKKPEIQLRWFPLADSFLRPHIGLRSLKGDAGREMPQFDFQYVISTLNLIDPTLLTDFRGKGTQNTIAIGAASRREEKAPDDDDDADVV